MYKRRSVILTISVMLAPILSWIAGGETAPGRATAATGNCGQTNQILQQTCGPYSSDLLQLESDTVQAYLTLHKLPPGDSALVYQYGRADLRSELRSLMFVNLLGIIQKPAGERTPHETNLYKWFQNAVYQNELLEYQTAVAEHQRFLNDPCHFTLDPDIASQSNLTYNGAPFCYANPFLYAFGYPTTPGPDYYLAFGLKNSYNLGISGTAANGVTLLQTQLYDQANLAYGILPAAVTYAAASTIYGLGITAPFAPVIFGGFGPAEGAFTAIVNSAAVEGTGPLAIIAIAAEIAIEAGMQAVSQQQQQDQINDQTNTYNNLLQNCNSVDLLAFATDTSQVGLYKLRTTFLAVSLPDVPSTLALPQHREDVDPVVGLYQINGGTTDSFTYNDWNGINWTVSTYGGWFIQKQTQSPSVTSFTATLSYLDPSNVQRYASRVGTNFLITEAKPNQADVPCPADPVTGLSKQGPSGCSSYVSPFLPIQTGPGIVANYAFLTSPVITSGATVTFTDGVFSQFQLTGTTNNFRVTPTFSIAGTLPQGFSVYSNNFGTYLTNDPAVATPVGSYAVTVNASAGQPNYVASSAPLTINVIAGDSITALPSLTGITGQPVNYSIATSTTSGHGNPVIALVNLPLPAGLVFRDAGNGTASITGIPTGPFTSSCSQSFCGVQTNFGAKQAIQINISGQNSAAFASPSTWTFTPNIPNKLTIKTVAGTVVPAISGVSMNPPSPTVLSGVVSPNTAVTNPVPSQPWLTLKDNGDGTATLAGTPPQTASALTFYLVSASSYTYPAVQTFSLRIGSNAVITSQPTVAASVFEPINVQINTSSSQAVVTLAGNLSVSNASLPNGVSANLTSGGSLQISGTPQPNSGGTYQISVSAGPSALLGRCAGGSQAAAHPASKEMADLVTVNASASLDPSLLSATQNFQLLVLEAPKITTAPTVTFFTGVANSFGVRTTGFPKAQAPIALDGAQPMRVTVSGILPAGLTFSDLSPLGEPTGTGVLSGTPTVTGAFPLTFTAQNGVGSAATQIFTLLIKLAGDLNGDGVVNCADAAMVKAAFGQYIGQPNYNPDADVNHDGVVDIRDLAFVSSRLPAGTRCQ